VSHETTRAPPPPQHPGSTYANNSNIHNDFGCDAAADPTTYLPAEYISITAHSFSSYRLIAYYVLCVLTGGILALACKHNVALRVKLTRAPCPVFRDADFVLVQTLDGSYEEVEVVRIRGRMRMDVASGIVAGPTGVWDPIIAPTELRQNVTGVESHVQLQEERAGLLGFHGLHVRGRSHYQPQGGSGESVERTFAFFEYKKQRYVYREGTNSFLVCGRYPPHVLKCKLSLTLIFEYSA
jgi:hypothetical protein